MSSHKKKNRPEKSGSPTRRPLRAAWVIAGLAVLVVVGALVLVCGHRPAASYSSPSPAVPSAEVPDEKVVFAGYAGSASCKDCHEEAYELWLHSNHGLAERPPTMGLDRIAFEPARSFNHASQRTSMRLDGTNFMVTTIGLSQTNEAHAVERVIGNNPLRQFLVAAPGGRLQTLEASYDPHRNEWFNVYGSEDRKPGEWGHWTGRGMNWNNMCADCHNTRVRKNYDEATDSYHTTMAEPTVSCEACHGPLKAHNEWQAKHGKSGLKDPTVPKISRERAVDNCGFCHARRSELTGDFKPGDDFSDHLRLTIVDDSDTYHPDGQVRDEDYEYASFLSSRMHARGVVCMDCHNSHSMKTLAPGNWLCMRCHNGSYTNAPVIEPVAHSRHKVFGYDTNAVLTNFNLTIYKPKEIKETGGECVNCHMPQTAYMQRHWRHDHGFTIPDPLLTKQLGVPNACNRCHQDKDADWALKHCDEWYGAKMERPTRRRVQIIASARKGEAGARDGLLGLLATEENPYWRAVAAGLLEHWTGEPQVNTALIRSLSDTNALVRAECVRALEPMVQANAPAAVEAVRGRLNDPICNVRVAAAWALRSSIDPASKAGIELLHSLDLNADQPVGQMQKGAYALARNDSAQAVAHYQKAVEWDPNSAAIRHDFAVVLAGLNRNQEAVQQLEAACRLAPTDAEYRFKLGLALSATGNLPETITSLREAVRLDPRHGRAWYNLGLALNSAGETWPAIEALTRAEGISTADPQIPYARATILARAGRLQEAKAAASRALEINSNFSDARALLDQLSR